MPFWQTILIFLAAVLVLGLVLKVFKVGIKAIVKLVVNAVIGFAVLYLLNLIPGINMPVNWWSILLTGFLGIPAVIGLFIYSLFI